MGPPAKRPAEEVGAPRPAKSRKGKGQGSGPDAEAAAVESKAAAVPAPKTLPAPVSGKGSCAPKTPPKQPPWKAPPPAKTRPAVAAGKTGKQAEAKLQEKASLVKGKLSRARPTRTRRPPPRLRLAPRARQCPSKRPVLATSRCYKGFRLGMQGQA